MSARKNNGSNGGGNGHGRDQKAKELDSTPESAENKVVDFVKFREDRLEEKQRKHERYFLSNLISVYSSAGGPDGRDLCAIELVEISETGCRFLIEARLKQVWPSTANLPIRLYFGRDTFLEIQATIVWSRPAIENGRRYVMYGCTVDSSTSSYGAYAALVQFVKQYTLQARRDLGQATSFYS